MHGIPINCSIFYSYNYSAKGSIHGTVPPPKGATYVNVIVVADLSRFCQPKVQWVLLLVCTEQ
jgi:hypothetical protein